MAQIIRTLTAHLTRSSEVGSPRVGAKNQGHYQKTQALLTLLLCHSQTVHDLSLHGRRWLAQLCASHPHRGQVSGSQTALTSKERKFPRSPRHTSPLSQCKISVTCLYLDLLLVDGDSIAMNGLGFCISKFLLWGKKRDLSAKKQHSC